MRTYRLAALVAAACGLAGPAFGQALSLQDRGFAEAVGYMLLVDHLRARCDAADRPPLSDQLRAWDTANRTPALRRATATARQDPQGEANYRQLEDALTKTLAPLDAQACVALQSWLNSPKASLATTQPQVLAALAGPARAAPAPAPTARAAQASARPANATTPAASAGALHGYGLIQTYGMGYGGMITVKFQPAVLFQNGEILTDLDGLADPAGDRRANPAHWSRWRQTGGVYEYATQSGKWNKVLNNQVWRSAPVTSLSGRFTHTGGGGNLAVGGTDAVFTQRSFDFLPGGRVARDALASASSSVEGGGSKTSTTTASRSGQRVGRYTVQGLTLQIAFDDGSRESHTFMTYPRDPGIIWIDGAAYTRK